MKHLFLIASLLCVLSTAFIWSNTPTLARPSAPAAPQSTFQANLFQIQCLNPSRMPVSMDQPRLTIQNGTPAVGFSLQKPAGFEIQSFMATVYGLDSNNKVENGVSFLVDEFSVNQPSQELAGLILGSDHYVLVLNAVTAKLSADPNSLTTFMIAPDLIPVLIGGSDVNVVTLSGSFITTNTFCRDAFNAAESVCGSSGVENFSCVSKKKKVSYQCGTSAK